MASPLPDAAARRALAAALAAAVAGRFASLPKAGKCQAHEHTVLAGIAAFVVEPEGAAPVEPAEPPRLHVVALGSGTKCLGASKRSRHGDVLHDSHAEVVARRALVAWAHGQLALAAAHHRRQREQGQEQEQEQGGGGRQPAGCGAAFAWCPEARAFRLRPGVRFAMYVSQPPCGDASIYGGGDGGGQHAQHGGVPGASAAAAGDGAACGPRSDGAAAPALAAAAQEQAAAAGGRTGAKLLRPAGAADVRDAARAAAGGGGADARQQQPPAVPGAADVEAGPQALGALRRKPGKGDPTLSLSCSDKIARWACLGLQGCLLSACLDAPLGLELLAVSAPPGGGEPQQQQALGAAVEAAGARAVRDRLAGAAALLPPPFRLQAPAVVAVGPPDPRLGLSPDATRKSPSGVSINWSCQMPLLDALAAPSARPGAAAAAGVHEVTLAAHGRRAGASKKELTAGSAKTRSRLCPAAMHDAWRALLAAAPPELAARCGAAGGGGGGGGGGDGLAAYRADKARAGAAYTRSRERGAMKEGEKVRVFVRTRPTARPFEGIRTHKDGETITVTFPKDEASGLINNQLETLTLKVTVYETCAHGAVDSVLSGFNATLFCYGQTGAGKTFTMSGDAASYAHRGIVPRALHHIFRQVDLRSDRLFKVAVSYMEIYNEALYDLLADDPAGSAERLTILDGAAGTVVRGLTRVEVGSEEEALAQFFLGEQGRSTAVHVLNSNSSRSHVVFSVYVEGRTSAEARERATLSKLHLVDLAGSERTKKTQAEGLALREAACINKSLTFLEQVVQALARRDAHVPFRQCKLTEALRDALGGNSRTVMVANLWPEAPHLEECASTLRFAARVRCLETAAVVNESNDPGLALARATRVIRELRAELAMRDMLSGRGRIVYEDLSPGEQAELQQLVSRYLAGAAELDELPTESLKRIRETYKAFKAVTLAGGWAGGGGAAGPRGPAAAAAAGQGAAAELEAGGVGEVDAGGGFCVGSAPAHARPPASPVGGAAGVPGGQSRGASPPRGSPSPRGTAQALQQLAGTAKQQRPGSPLAHGQRAAAAAAAAAAAVAAEAGPAAAALAGEQAGGAGAEPPLDRNALFSRFKHGVAEGRRAAEAVRAAQQQVAELKQQIKDGGAQVNGSKAAIDTLSAQLETRRLAAPAGRASAAGSSSSGSGGGEVLDDEEHVLLQQLRAAKTSYRCAFDDLRERRSALDPALDGVAAAKARLLAGFEAWLDGSPQVAAAWRADASGDDESGGEGEEGEDPGEAFDRADLACQAAAAGDPASAAFFAAAKKAARALGARGCASPGASARRGAL
ncbi:KLP1 [Scenedesmus sp. PABB004]|nr:KLP1 [Scenedesmus sp. PABB004]